MAEKEPYTKTRLENAYREIHATEVPHNKMNAAQRTEAREYLRLMDLRNFADSARESDEAQKQLDEFLADARAKKTIVSDPGVNGTKAEEIARDEAASLSEDFAQKAKEVVDSRQTMQNWVDALLKRNQDGMVERLDALEKKLNNLPDPWYTIQNRLEDAFTLVVMPKVRELVEEQIKIVDERVEGILKQLAATAGRVDDAERRLGFHNMWLAEFSKYKEVDNLEFDSKVLKLLNPYGERLDKMEAKISAWISELQTWEEERREEWDQKELNKLDEEMKRFDAGQIQVPIGKVVYWKLIESELEFALGRFEDYMTGAVIGGGIKVFTKEHSGVLGKEIFLSYDEAAVAANCYISHQREVCQTQHNLSAERLKRLEGLKFQYQEQYPVYVNEGGRTWVEPVRLENTHATWVGEHNNGYALGEESCVEAMAGGRVRLTQYQLNKLRQMDKHFQAYQDLLGSMTDEELYLWKQAKETAK